MKKQILKAVSAVALNQAKKESNSACLFIGYQVPEPKEIKKFRKF